MFFQTLRCRGLRKQKGQLYIGGMSIVERCYLDSHPGFFINELFFPFLSVQSDIGEDLLLYKGGKVSSDWELFINFSPQIFQVINFVIESIRIPFPSKHRRVGKVTQLYFL